MNYIKEGLWQSLSCNVVDSKSQKHERRFTNQAPDIIQTQPRFFSNSKNKSQFIVLLGETLARYNIQTSVASWNAGILIMKKFIESISNKTVVLVGEVDLIVIATAFCDLINNSFLRSQAEKI